MAGPAVFGTNPYYQSRDVVGTVVTVLQGTSDRRGLELQDYRSRAVTRAAIHELMLTDNVAEPGSTVDRVALIGFVEVTEGGVILVGSTVSIGDHYLGIVAGFDETHMPNHYNICLSGSTFVDGAARQIQVGDALRIQHRQSS